jgi:hypothetical protein
MILFTLLYSNAILFDNIPPLFMAMLFVHIGLQCAFTLAAHARELQHCGLAAPVVAIILAGCALAGLWLLDHGQFVDWQSQAELVYRLFMGFYGLVFPAYVWLVMLPTRSSQPRPALRNVLVFALAVLLAGPMFWMGFVMTQMIWLVPGLAIVLLAKLLTSSRCGQLPQQNSAPT